MTGWLVALLVALVSGLGLGYWLRRRVDAKKGRYRVLERPNSYYAAPGVLRIERQERWEAILGKQIHPVNRSEVERLLEKVRALGVEKLTPSEKDFLDRMAAN